MYYVSGKIISIMYVEELCVLRKWKNYMYYISEKLYVLRMWKNYEYYVSGRIMFIT